MVTELLALGADPNARGAEDGTTALMWAANRGLKAAVEALLAAGARADPVAKDGWTALAAAQMAGYDDIAALIAAAR
jgi:ankyrin repeat protein